MLGCGSGSGTPWALTTLELLVIAEANNGKWPFLSQLRIIYEMVAHEWKVVDKNEMMVFGIFGKKTADNGKVASF